MIKVSRWGRAHRHTARLLLVVAHLLLVWIAVYFGQQMAMAGWSFSGVWLYPLVLLFFAACAAYPSKRTSATYVQRKTCDTVVAVSGFLMIACATAQLDRRAVVYPSVQAAHPAEMPVFHYPEVQTLLTAFQQGEKTGFSRKEKRLIRKEFNYQLLQYATATFTGNKKQQGNAGTIILLCVAAVGLLFLVGSLACTLSCNGHDAAAIVVGIVGTAAVVLGLVLLIKSLKRKKMAARTSPTG